MKIRADIESKSGRIEVNFTVDALVIAGWAGRDRDKMEAHIRELEELGVARPRTTPTFYRVSSARLTREATIQHTGGDSSGEAEAVLLAANGALYVGLGSDHTDRTVESYGVTVSKQLCDKPVSGTFWPLDEVVGHWDSLMLRAWTVIDGERVLYQEGALSELLPPAELVRGYAGSDALKDGVAMLCGTMPAIGGIRAGERFECELSDPVLSRRIALAYNIDVLPIVEEMA